MAGFLVAGRERPVVVGGRDAVRLSSCAHATLDQDGPDQNGPDQDRPDQDRPDLSTPKALS
jgi:hypothetical protein